jgi:predicted peroxiredoxin
MDNIPILTPKEIITTISNAKTGEIYKDEDALKAANIPEEDIRRDVKVIMPALDLFAKTK